MRFKLDGKVLEFDEDTVTNKELIHLERELGLTVRGLMEGVNAGSMVAITGMVWMARRRTEPALAFDDIEFSLGGFEIMDDDGQQDGPGNDGAGISPAVSPMTSTPTSSPSLTGGAGPETRSSAFGIATT
jgi:hypothetical protein